MEGHDARAWGSHDLWTSPPTGYPPCWGRVASCARWSQSDSDSTMVGEGLDKTACFVGVAPAIT